jgi:hypothetical protein
VRAELYATPLHSARRRTLDVATRSRTTAGRVRLSLVLDRADRRWARRHGTLSVSVRLTVV